MAGAKGASAPLAVRNLFLLKKPSDTRIDEFLRLQHNEPFSYEEVGTSWEGASNMDGYVVDHNRVRLGTGEEVFARAKEALRDWRMFGLGWVRICWPDTRIEVGNTVAVLGNHYGFWSLNACRIVYLIEEDAETRRFGFAYGTLPEHAESGEERFTVEWNRDDEVWYDIYAFSKPNSALARLGQSLARGLQRRFARDSMRAMEDVVRQP
ncbi:MAG: DUF1990 domain-containing protein [Rubrobacteraceae bacterium]